MSRAQTIILQGTENSVSTAYSALANAARTDTYEEAIFVAPFVTGQGVRMLNGIANVAEAEQAHWLVGLDGVITTPAALRAIAYAALTNSYKGWSQSFDQPTLHAKVYMLFTRKPPKLALYIGSANATGGGLSDNIEAGTLLVLEGADASQVQQSLLSWLEEMYSSAACKDINDEEIKSYAARYQKPKRRIVKRVARVIGVERQPIATARPSSAYTWIEIAVRGGSSNQIEICKAMAPFFTNGREGDSTDFILVDIASGIAYPGNRYRFRSGNAGHRVEVNTDLARAFDLKSASQRRDIILFRRTTSPNRFIIEMYAAKARKTQQLINEGERQERVNNTIAGPSGRRYYI